MHTRLLLLAALTLGSIGVLATHEIQRDFDLRASATHYRLLVHTDEMIAEMEDELGAPLSPRRQAEIRRTALDRATATLRDRIPSACDPLIEAHPPNRIELTFDHACWDPYTHRTL